MKKSCDLSFFKILDTGISSAEENMAFDFKLLEELALQEKQPILHLYDWLNPSATYGYFTDPYTFLNKNGVKEIGLELARRPTGGGIIFHLSDFAFSILIPASHPLFSLNTLENYALINSMVIDVIKKFNQETTPQLLTIAPKLPDALHQESHNFCMGKPTIYDVMLNGKKVGGAAQRRTKHGLLHQGSISITLPDMAILEKLFNVKNSIIESFIQNTYCLIPKDASQNAINESRQQIKHLMKESILFSRHNRDSV